MTSKLTPIEKLEWAKQQRLEGNRLFKKQEYKEAMDVYLTCLVAMEKDSLSPTTTSSSHNVSVGRAQIEFELQLPILLNLSLCALKLGMLSKTQEFCNLAMEMSCGRTNPKVFYRRGKARMLMGNYHLSRLDLDVALELLISQNNDIDDDGNLKKQKEIQVIRREIQKLDNLERSGKVNERKQKKAMKKILGGQMIHENNHNVEFKSMISKPRKDVPDEQHHANGNKNKWTIQNVNEIIQQNKDSDLENEHLYHDKKQVRLYSRLRSNPNSSKNNLKDSMDEILQDVNVLFKTRFLIFAIFYIIFAGIWHYLNLDV